MTKKKKAKLKAYLFVTCLVIAVAILSGRVYYNKGYVTGLKDGWDLRGIVDKGPDIPSSYKF